VAEDGSCRQCLTNCIDCRDLGKCLKCRRGYFVSSDGMACLVCDHMNTSNQSGNCTQDFSSLAMQNSSNFSPRVSSISEHSESDKMTRENDTSNFTSASQPESPNASGLYWDGAVDDDYDWDDDWEDDWTTEAPPAESEMQDDSSAQKDEELITDEPSVPGNEQQSEGTISAIGPHTKDMTPSFILSLFAPLMLSLLFVTTAVLCYTYSRQLRRVFISLRRAMNTSQLRELGIDQELSAGLTRDVFSEGQGTDLELSSPGLNHPSKAAR